MSEHLTCPNGRRECDFAAKHEFALAGSILRMIGAYAKDNEAYACPECLRNAIMALAALLHLEAVKMDDGGCGRADAGSADAFAEAARERFLSLADGVFDIDMLAGKRRLM